MCAASDVGSAWWARASTSVQSARLMLTQLETNAASQPLGSDDHTPRFSWALNCKQRGTVQTAFRVLVASAPQLAHEGKADIWDSKRVCDSSIGAAAHI
jgi:alpha-L-rhamnosidase